MISGRRANSRKLANRIKKLRSKLVGYSDILNIYVGLGHFLGFKILNFNIFGGFQKNKYFWDMNIL